MRSTAAMKVINRKPRQANPNQMAQKGAGGRAMSQSRSLRTRRRQKISGARRENIRWAKEIPIDPMALSTVPIRLGRSLTARTSPTVVLFSTRTSIRSSSGRSSVVIRIGRLTRRSFRISPSKTLPSLAWFNSSTKISYETKFFHRCFGHRAEFFYSQLMRHSHRRWGGLWCGSRGDYRRSRHRKRARGCYRGGGGSRHWRIDRSRYSGRSGACLWAVCHREVGRLRVTPTLLECSAVHIPGRRYDLRGVPPGGLTRDIDTGQLFRRPYGGY